MRTTASLSALFLLFTIASCNDDNERSYVEYYHPKPGVIFASNSTVGAARNPAHGKPGHRCDIAVGDPLPSSASLPVTSNSFPATPQPEGNLATSTSTPQTPGPGLNSLPGMNPAHGKPGHRCDIAVGAPLSTPLQNAVNKQGSSYPNSNNNLGSLNPAHGQPGHRCDIAVGAPLNSAPAKPVNTNNSVPVTTAANGNAKLNPAHGQPGHRCDIAVGAPLNSAPAKSNPATTVPTPAPLATKKLTPEDSLAIWNALPSDSTGAKINPAHGQPGHDCSVAVGKPLKQKN